MGTALQNFKIPLPDPIHKPVIVIDTTAPPSGEVIPQRFRFSNPLIPVAFTVADQLVYAIEDLPVRLFPMEIVVPGVVMPDFNHLRHPRSAHAPFRVPHPFPQQLFSDVPYWQGCKRDPL